MNQIDPLVYVYLCKCKRKRHAFQQVEGLVPQAIACKCGRAAKLAETHEASELYRPDDEVVEQIREANVDSGEWLDTGGLILR